MTAVASTAALQVIKGDLPPLTAAQTELVAIFIEYLRNLPEFPASWGDACKRTPQQPTCYLAIFNILHEHFNRRHGRLIELDSRFLRALTEEESDKFVDLFENGASPKDARLERKRELLAIARRKRQAVESIKRYEDERREIGLPPDESLRAMRGPVGLEVATQALGATEVPHDAGKA